MRSSTSGQFVAMAYDNLLFSPESLRARSHTYHYALPFEVKQLRSHDHNMELCRELWAHVVNARYITSSCNNGTLYLFRDIDIGPL